MAEESAVLKNLDKVSYGVAAVLGLILIVIPMLSGGAANEAAGALEKTHDRLEKKFKEPLKKKVESPDWVGRLARQWENPRAGPGEFHWASELAPALVLAYAEEERPDPEHHAGKLTSIECRRDVDKRQIYIQVAGTMSADNKLVVITEVILERQEDAGAFSAVPDFDFKGDFEFKDFNVRPGHTYTYKFTSVAETQAGAEKQLASADAKKESEPLGPTPPIPYDFSFHVINFGDDVLDPTVTARIEYWDYGNGKKVSLPTNTYKEKAAFGEKTEKGKQRYEIKLIQDGKVTVRDHFRRLKEGTEVLKGKDTKRRSVESFSPLALGASAATGPDAGGTPVAPEKAEKAEKAEKVPADEKKPAEPPEQTPPKKKKGRRQFGN